MRIGTIIALNYLPYARVLAASYAEQHPDAPCHVLVVDDVDGVVDAAAEPFDLVRPPQLGIERFEAMPAMYDVTELCTAVKPWFLRWMLEQGRGDPVAYFDPDIRFHSEIGNVEALAREGGVVLTPHVIDALPSDGEQPREIDILLSGVFNLGFIAMAPGEETTALLDWWSERLRYDCVIDHDLGYFVDQRWFDLVPSMLPGVRVLRDPTVNVAYWNLHGRSVTRGDGGYLVDGEPLSFFHFSGFDPARPESLSKHQTRTRLGEHPGLAQLCAEYAQELRENGFGRDGPAYRYATLADGTPLDRRLRRLYREGERAGAFRGDPFADEGTEEFLAWLNEPVDPGAARGVTRLCHDLYAARPDLRGAWPDLDGQDGADLVRWVRQRGRIDFELPDAVVPGGPAEPDPEWATEPATPAAEPPVPLGVNLFGFLRSEVGVGEAGRQVVNALDAAGVPVAPVRAGPAPANPEGIASREGHAYAALSPDAAPFGMNVVCVNADLVPRFARGPAAPLLARNYSIGYWWWEVTTFPEEWTGAFAHLDEVWVGTRHIAQALQATSPIPVVRMPIPVDVPSPPAMSRADLGLPEGFLFLFLFDYLSVFERKNPLAAVEAFKRAFAPGVGASLAIKTINEATDREAHDRLRVAAGEHPDVHVVDRYVTAAQKDAMIASCDCYVSLHRAEGFGLTLAEAMSLERPVIATAYSGNLDFMTPVNSWLVDHTMRSIGSDGGFAYPAGGEWADPDLDSAAAAMRAVFDDPEGARERAARGAADIRRTHSREAAGEAMRRRLHRIHAWRARAQATPGAPPVADGRTLDALLEGGPDAPGRARRGGLAALTRRGALRVMRPFTAYQRAVDEELGRELERVRSEREADRQRAGRSVAEALLHTRRQEEELRRLQAELTQLRERLDAHDG